ncbi:hypothetical protein SFB5_159G1, partial [Candidatus Arthromitus sp. SFB-5]
PSGNVIDKNDERFKYLNDSGFNIFCSSMKKMNNKDCFKIQPYVNISRDLICYDITSLHHNEYYDILKDIIINPRKAKKLYKEGIRE